MAPRWLASTKTSRDRPAPGRSLAYYQLLRFGLFVALAAVFLVVALLVVYLLGYRLDRDMLESVAIGVVFAAAPVSTVVSYFALRSPRERAAAAVTARAEQASTHRTTVEPLGPRSRGRGRTKRGSRRRGARDQTSPN